MSVENNRCTLLCFYHERHWNSFTEKKEFSKINWIIFGFSMEIAIPAYFSFLHSVLKGAATALDIFVKVNCSVNVFFLFCFRWSCGAGKDEKEFWIQSYLFLCFSFLYFFSSEFCKKLVFILFDVWEQNF